MSSMESKVSKNFRMDRLLRDSQKSNIIQEMPMPSAAAAVPMPKLTPPMAFQPHDVGTSKSAMALSAGSAKQPQPQKQMRMMPLPTMGNFFVPFTPSPSSMPFPTPPGSSSSSSFTHPGMPMSMGAFMSPPFMAPQSSPSAFMPHNNNNITTPQLHHMQMFYNNPQLMMAATAAYFQQQQQRNQQMAMLQHLMTPPTPAAVTFRLLPTMAQNAIESSSSGGGNNTSTTSKGSNGNGTDNNDGSNNWRRTAKMPLEMLHQIAGPSNAIGMEAQQPKQRAIGAFRKHPNFPGQPQHETPRIRKEMPNKGRGNGTQNAVLKCHMAKKAKCNICGKKVSRSYLKTHHLIHSGQKPYVCPFPGCQKAFADRSNCRAHEHTHYPEKPYGCNQCEERFKLKQYLSKHIQNIHVRANACRQ